MGGPSSGWIASRRSRPRFAFRIGFATCATTLQSPWDQRAGKPTAMGTKPIFVSLETTARILGVPLQWLRGEVTAGRLPSIQAGRRVLCSPLAVEGVLLKR